MNNNANAAYWEERMVNIFLEGEKDVLQVSKELKSQYKQAVKNIEDEILKFYGKYQTVSGLDMKTIKKQLNKEELKSFHNTLDEIIEYAKNHQMDKDYKLRMKLLNMKTRISRLEELKTNIEFEIQKLAIKEQEQLKSAMENAYTDTYYKTLHEVDKFAGVSTSFAIPNVAAIEKLINTPINVKNYAVGLYKNKNNLMTLLSSYIPQGIILGYNPNKVANIASKALDTNYNSTVRLVRTEYNYIMNQAVIDGYKEADIEQYQILAALDERTCTECGELDLKLFEVGNEIIGVNYPPFHPNCRCTTIPYFEPDEFDVPTTRVAKDKNGNTYEVPSNLSYNKWLEGLNTTKKDGIFYDMDGKVQKGASNLTKIEKEAVAEYVSNSNNISDDNKHILANAIKNKGDVEGTVTLYRNVSPQELGFEKLREIRNNPNDLIGKVVKSNGFLSTAKTSEGTAGFFGQRIKITGVENTAGLDISKISQKANEQEVLFNIGTEYKITKCDVLYDEDGDYITTEIEAIIIGNRKN